MKVLEQPRVHESTLDGEAVDFKVTVNAFAFRTLVDGIYSDKISSAIRELMSNAWDSQVRRGDLDIPFTVTLPTELNPVFSVRDYGTGMDHEFVMTTYATLFESSKRDSDTEVGAFGLGKMTPLAYTDSFTLRCFGDGEVRVYNISITGNGTPRITLVVRTESDEFRGVEVSFAVRPEDFRAFRRSAEVISLGFDVQPEWRGVNVVVPQTLYRGNGWRIIQRPAYEGVRTTAMMVRMGCAVYPGMDYHNVRVPDGTMLLLDVPIGSIEVTASRESVQWDHSSRERVYRLARDAKRELAKVIFDTAKGLVDPYDIAKFMYENSRIISVFDRNEIPETVRGWSDSIIFPKRTQVIDGQKIETTGVARRGTGWGRTDLWDQVGAVRFAQIPSIRLVWDDGTKIVRRRARIRADSYYITTERTVFDNITKLLRLTKEQTFKIDEIPDVNVPVRNASTPRKVIESTRPWTTRFQAKAWLEGYDTSTAWYSQWERELLTALGISSTEVMYLTPTEIKRALEKDKIDPNKSISVLARQYLDQSWGIVEQEMKYGLYLRWMPEEISKNFKHSCKPPVPAHRESAHASMLITLAEIVYPNKLQAMRDAHQIEVEEAKSRYPMLFSPTEEQQLEYIKMVDTCNKR